MKLFVTICSIFFHHAFAMDDMLFGLETTYLKEPLRLSTQFCNTNYAMGALHVDGSVTTFGNSFYGGDSLSVKTLLQSNVKELFCTTGAIAALKTDGSVVTWGSVSHGGDNSNVANDLKSGVQEIYSNENAFLAIKSNTAVCWGSYIRGGYCKNVNLSNILKVFHTRSSFAVLKNDGSVETWGSDANSNLDRNELQSNIETIFTTNSAFAALKTDGSVVTWGLTLSGGDSTAVQSQLTSGVENIFASKDVFAALKSDGSVVAWGHRLNGGNPGAEVLAELSSDVTMLYPADGSFHALKLDGSVVSWGDSDAGDNSAVKSELYDIVDIVANRYACAALRKDGKVITWGNKNRGGDSSAYQNELEGVISMYKLSFGFAALTDKGTLVKWGGSDNRVVNGVQSVYQNGVSLVYQLQNGPVGAIGVDISLVKSELQSDVEEILVFGFMYLARKKDNSYITFGIGDQYVDIRVISDELLKQSTRVVATDAAHAFLLEDGSVVTRGSIPEGGDSTNVKGQLYNIKSIHSTGGAFAALRQDNIVVTWGQSILGGRLSREVRAKKIYSNDNAFVAITQDQTITAWGHGSYGGSVNDVLFGTIRHVVPNSRAFVALGDPIVAWGSSSSGGDISDVDWTQVVRVVGTNTKWSQQNGAFAGIKKSGSVVTWGSAPLGGDSGSVKEFLANGVDSVIATTGAFAAFKKESGAVVAWGSTRHGGDIDETMDNPILLTNGVVKVLGVGRQRFGFFVALRSDGTALTWGYGARGSYSIVSNGAKDIFAFGGGVGILKEDQTFDFFNTDSANIYRTIEHVKRVQVVSNALGVVTEEEVIVFYINGEFKISSHLDRVNEASFSCQDLNQCEIYQFGDYLRLYDIGSEAPTFSPTGTDKPTSSPVVIDSANPTASPVIIGGTNPTSSPTGMDKPTSSPVVVGGTNPTPSPETQSPTMLPTQSPTTTPTSIRLDIILGIATGIVVLASVATIFACYSWKKNQKRQEIEDGIPIISPIRYASDKKLDLESENPTFST